MTMLMPKILAGVLALGVLLAAPARDGAAADGLTPKEKGEVEQLIRDYILKNPDVLIESVRGMEERQRQTAEKEAEQAIAANRTQLEQDTTSPRAGNPKGDVTVVEFFDYRCGYCKKVLPVVQELLKSDPNVRWLFKEFPILGPESVVAAEFATAAWQIAPDRYVPFHVALMEARGDLSEARVLEIATKVGIDPEKLKQARSDAGVKEKLGRNMALARKLQISGTPAFIIGGKLVPGAADLATMRELIASARSS